MGSNKMVMTHDDSALWVFRCVILVASRRVRRGRAPLRRSPPPSRTFSHRRRWVAFSARPGARGTRSPRRCGRGSSTRSRRVSPRCARRYHGHHHGHGSRCRHDARRKARRVSSSGTPPSAVEPAPPPPPPRRSGCEVIHVDCDRRAPMTCAGHAAAAAVADTGLDVLCNNAGVMASQIHPRRWVRRPDADQSPSHFFVREFMLRLDRAAERRGTRRAHVRREDGSLARRA